MIGFPLILAGGWMLYFAFVFPESFGTKQIALAVTGVAVVLIGVIAYFVEEWMERKDK